MRFEQLEYLIEINNQGSISSAAKNLHLSHQALSIAIKNLEEELGIPLLSRTAKGTSLTNEGKQLIEVSQDFFQKLNEITQRFKSANLQGNLTIAGNGPSLNHFLPKTIVMYYMKYPQVTIHSLRLLPEDAIVHFERGDVDLAFSTSTDSEKEKILAKYPGIKFHTCTTFQPGAILHETSPLAHKKSLTTHDLKNKTLLYNCASSSALDASNIDLFQLVPCTQRLYEPNRKIYQELLINNVGIGITSIMQGKCMENVPKGTVCLPIRDIENRHFGYYMYKEKAFSPLAQAFIEIFNNTSLLL